MIICLHLNLRKSMTLRAEPSIRLSNYLTAYRIALKKYIAHIVVLVFLKSNNDVHEPFSESLRSDTFHQNIEENK